MIIFNEYYGEGEFYYVDRENEIDFGFALNRMMFKDYYLLKNVIYFRATDIKEEEINYLKVNLNDLTKKE